MIKLGRSFWWLTFLIGVSYVVTQLPVMAGNPIVFRLTIALIIVLFLSGAGSVLSILGLDITRSSRASRKQVGEIFSEKFDLTNRSILPKAWLKISDLSELSSQAGSRVLTRIGGRQTRTYASYTLLERRGWFQLGPTQIETGDVFGLFLLDKVVAPQTRVLVLPFTFSIHRFPAPFGNLPGGRALRQKTLDVTPYAAGVREFVPGDPLKRIHWPTSARKQKLIVKEFEKDPMAEVWIFLDAQESAHHENHIKEKPAFDPLWWDNPSRNIILPAETGEYAVSVAASITNYYIQNKREVGFVCAGQNYSFYPAERGERQLGKILEMLAILKMKGEMAFEIVINSQLSHLARGSTVILITPSVEKGILAVVMELLERGLLPVVILIDEVSFGGVRDTSHLERSLIKQGVFTFVVREGDDLQAVLENPKLIYDSRLIYLKN